MAPSARARDVRDYLEAFDEGFYLEHHADVREAVDKGYFMSGRLHYEIAGFEENRHPCRFDAEWYARTHPDVLDALERREVQDALHHYVTVGRARGFHPHPFAQPIADVIAEASRRPARHGFALVACARWETRYITEWLLYHLSIGFDHVFLYCNDDDPSELYDEVRPFTMGASPVLTFMHFEGQGQQTGMYTHFLEQHSGSCRWSMFLDVDEFVLLRNINNIEAFVATRDFGFDALYFNWMIFGTSGFVRRPDGDVLENYTRRADGLHPFTKVLTRTGALRRPWPTHAFWHEWSRSQGPIRQFNVIGRRMDDYYENFPHGATAYVSDRAVRDAITATAVICHFSFKSEDDYLRRIERGLGGDFAGQAAWKTHFESDAFRQGVAANNVVEDTSLRTLWRAFKDPARIRRASTPDVA